MTADQASPALASARPGAAAEAVAQTAGEVVGDGGRRPLVLVSVGTDHHPFDRLIDWVDAWLEAGAAGRVDCVVQHGTSKAPRLARGGALIPHEELQQLMRDADVVVSHGGPTTIMEARRRGLVPVVVPRDGAAGEHVDNHQQLFAARMADKGLAVVAGSQAELADVLERALADPSVLAVGPARESGESMAASAARFGELVAELVDRSTPTPAVPVLFIGGSGRSGTTLLERLLGQIPGVTAAGELVHLWQRGVLDDELCGCGQPFSGCPFWAEVGKVAYGGWDRVPKDWAIGTRWAVDRTRRVPWLALPALATPGYRRRMRAWARYLRRLYTGLAEAGSARLVVDSSKHLSYSLLLRHVGVDLKVALVIRDPRAVAHAWAKLAVRPEVAGSEEYMPRFGVLKSTALWVVNTSGYGLLRLLRVPVHVIRYEDLVADPAGQLAALTSFAGLDGAVPPIHDGTVQLAADHTAAGNPIRFLTGDLTLRLDREWTTAMPAWRRVAVTAMTWPWLRRFGYPLRPGR